MPERSVLFFPSIDPDRQRNLNQHLVPGACLHQAVSAEDALAEMPMANGFVGKISPELLAASRNLEWVQSPTASLEHYLFPALIEHPCQLTNMRGLFSDVIADHVMAYILCFCRNLHQYVRLAARGTWAPVGGENDRASALTGPSYVCGFDRAHRHVSDQRIGIVGAGEIGMETARRALAFGMSVIAVDPHPASSGPNIPIWPITRMDEMLGLSDFVVIAAPHTPTTAGLFDQQRFAAMKRGSVLINIGRGAIVDMPALITALDTEQIGGAALDVFDEEPLPPEHPIWRRENVLITPHIAAASPHIAERHLAILSENVRRFLRREPLLNVVDKAAWC